jgi:hypothetical protein
MLRTGYDICSRFSNNKAIKYIEAANRAFIIRKGKIILLMTRADYIPKPDSYENY